ncbi:MAG: gliding motility-associated C-terminal domain-containing protein [Flavobacteriales bacterium]|nr:gliding motility-associated C-terminal domain-containing protein [Flavobacteriales bacterium]MCB9449508.1 gliding motility-associated C-terminal domain-containing protein [Flavobacteriales bacterium]
MILLMLPALKGNSQCITSIVKPSCPGKQDASLTVIYSGDNTTDKKYRLLKNASLLQEATSKGTYSFTGLGAAAYETEVYLSDGTGGWNLACGKNDTIHDPDTLRINFTTTNISCLGNQTGAIDVEIEGGSPPFTYVWTQGSTTQDISGLSAGSYAVVVSDVRGCVANESTTLTEPASGMEPTYTNTEIKCNGQATASIDVTVTGGTTPYTYSWSNGATSEDLSNLPAGTYILSLSDGNGCPDTVSVTVSQPDKFNAAAKGINISCNGLVDGMGVVKGDGGTPPYSYLWTTGETSDTIKGLDAGRYTVIALDANGCPSTNEAIVIEPTILKVYTVSDPPSCDRTEYSVKIVASGGTLPHKFLWSDGSTGGEIEEVIPGDYLITVSDARGCAATDTLHLELIEATCVTAPSGFTPNADGTNDTWTVRNIEKFPGAELQIFDLKGKLVFDTNERPLPWDGRSEGNDMPAGTYYYILDLHNNESKITGPITILR